MVALGFVECRDGRYQNGPVAAAFLAGGGPADLRPFLRFWNQLSYPLWNQLETAMRGQAVVRPAPTPEQQRIFSEGVEAITAGAARALASGYDFARHRRLLDLGGGTGSFLLTILSQHPHLAGTLPAPNKRGSGCWRPAGNQSTSGR